MNNESQTTPSSKLAIISRRLGIVSLFCLGFLTGIPAIVLGIWALIHIRRSHGKLSGARAAGTGIILGALGFWFYALFLWPWFNENITLAQGVSRTKADMRSIAVALDAYYRDYKEYPAQVETLTKPVAYITEIPKDPFAKGKQHFYIRFDMDSRKLWLLGSFGPNFKRDLSEEELLQHAVSEGILSSFLALKAYDPSNGTFSEGDIIRTNERSY